MAATANDILTLLLELEQADPLDFGDMAIDEETARRIVVLSMAKFSKDLAEQNLEAELRETLALATTARVLLDNLQLQYRQLKSLGAPVPEAGELLRTIATRAMNAD